MSDILIMTTFLSFSKRTFKKLFYLCFGILYAGMILLNHNLTAQSIEQGSRKNPSFPIYLASGARVITGVDKTDDILLSPVNHKGDSENILYLSFDSHRPETLQEDTGRYKIQHSSYIRSDDAVSGSAAHFSRLENRILIRSPSNAWPLNGEDKDFTLEMWIKPLYYYRYNEIFKKMSIIDGKKTGLEISIEKERIICRMENIFQDLKGHTSSRMLHSRSVIPLNTWSHIALSYKSSTGKINLLINNSEQDADWAKENSDVLSLKFHPLDHSPITIGETYSGLIDELRITSEFTEETFNKSASKYAPLKLNQSTFLGKQSAGVVYSKVIKIPYSRTGNLKYSATEPEGSILAFYVRTSKKIFSPDLTADEMPWQRIEKSTDKLKNFSYIQWKAEMKSDPEGNESPLLHSVTLNYDKINPPSQPVHLRIIPEFLNQGKICLEWAQSPEVHFDKNSGYIIYYGLKKGRYDGKLQFQLDDGLKKPIRGEIKNQPMTDYERHQEKYKPHILAEKLKGKIRQCVDNKMVADNIYLSLRKDRMPSFMEMNTYYFAVSSWSPENGESALSNEVTAVCKGKPDL